MPASSHTHNTTKTTDTGNLIMQCIPRPSQSRAVTVTLGNTTCDVCCILYCFLWAEYLKRHQFHTHTQHPHTNMHTPLSHTTPSHHETHTTQTHSVCLHICIQFMPDQHAGYKLTLTRSMLVFASTTACLISSSFRRWVDFMSCSS